MSQNDSTPEHSGTGSGGSSSYGRGDEPEYGQRIEGAPSGPSYEAPRYGQGGPDDRYAAPQHGQDQNGRPGHYPPPQYGQGRYDQGRPGYYPPQQPGGGQPGAGPYDQGQYDQGQYDQGQYGQQGYYPPQYPGAYGQGQYGPGQYDMGYYAPARPAGSGLGIAALVLGIVALLTSWMVGLGLVPGVVGLVLGIVAVRKLGRVAGASKAVPIIGIVLSALGILASIAFFFALTAFMGGIVEGPCGQYMNDPAAFEQCLNEQMGVDTLQQ